MHVYKLLISLAFVGYGSYILYQSYVPDVVPVPAVVTQSHKTYYGSSPDRPGRYRYTFEYTYTYRDDPYRSTRYTYGGRDTSRAVCAYRTGDAITAYVRTDNPAVAVIDRSVSGFVYALTAIGGLMLLHTILTYWIEQHKVDTFTLPARVARDLGAAIGMTFFFGGIGYFVYTLIVVASTKCVS